MESLQNENDVIRQPYSPGSGRRNNEELAQKYEAAYGQRRSSSPTAMSGRNLDTAQGQSNNGDAQTMFAPRISQGQIMSHYFGFGNLQIEHLKGSKSKTTGLE